jgi:predicted RNase H-like HicB family nuclease
MRALVAEYLKRPYARLVRPDEDPFGAQILEFPGCVALGATPVEALNRLEAVAESWIFGVLAKGECVPAPALKVAAIPPGHAVVPRAASPLPGFTWGPLPNCAAMQHHKNGKNT